MKYLFIVLLFEVGRCESKHINKEEGEACGLVKDDGWTCQTLQHCPQIGDFRRNHPDICGFKDREPIICCPPSSEKTTSPPLIPNTSIKESLGPLSDNSDKILSSFLSNIPSSAGGNSRPPLSIFKCVEYEVNLCKDQIKPEEYEVENVTTDSISKRNDNGSLLFLSRGNPKMFSFLAVIGYGEKKIKWDCEGTIVSENWILTTAYCTRSSVGNATWVKVYELKKSPNEFGLTVQVSKIIVHPEYKPPAMYHDIGLLKTVSGISFLGARPICLSPLKVLPRKLTTISWGNQTLGDLRGSPLMLVDVKRQDTETCENLFNQSYLLPRGFDEATMFCAVEKDQDSCTDLSGGGPLFYNSSLCLRVQVGLMSLRKSCGVEPSVYTRVSYYLPWIENIIWPAFMSSQ